MHKSFIQQWRIEQYQQRQTRSSLWLYRGYIDEKRSFTKNHAEALADAYENELYEAGLNHDEV